MTELWARSCCRAPWTGISEDSQPQIIFWNLKRSVPFLKVDKNILEEKDGVLRRNHGLIASFSRALLDGLLIQQSEEEYDAVLDAAIQSIYEASNT